MAGTTRSKGQPTTAITRNATSGTRLTPDQAKKLIVTKIAEGFTVEQACKAAGKSVKSYEAYRRDDEKFRNDIDAGRALANRKRVAEREHLSFEDFRAKYLKMRTFPHQRQWIDVLEGRQPEQIEGTVFEPGRPNRLLVNVPPGHAKSTTMIDYVTYRIAMNPGVHIMYISKTLNMAQKFVYAIKQRLTHPAYLDLQLAYAPAGGYKESADQWTAKLIYLGGDDKSEEAAGAKDPTLEALGLGGQIYGARAELILVDDAVVLSNAHEWEKQMEWLRQEVSSRLPPTGKLVVVGTRVAAQDLYKELRNPEHYSDRRTPWTYLAQPAVLDQTSDDPTEWVTLWPRSDQAFPESEEEPDADGLYTRWDGPTLAEVRNDVGPKKWSLVYQQADIVEDSTFPARLVNASINKMRKIGPLIAGAPGQPKDGALGMYIVAGLDPAMTGFTAAVVMAVEPKTGKRYVLDVENMKAPTPEKIKNLIIGWTDRYRISEWRVESNAFQLFLTQDEGIRTHLASRGCKYLPQYTSRVNKWDDNFGVASMAPLFGIERNGAPEGRLIELPDTQSAGVRALTEQLITWQPDPPRGMKTDAVMALWFAEIAARQKVQMGSVFGGHYMDNPFASRMDVANRQVVDLAEWADYRLRA